MHSKSTRFAPVVLGAAALGAAAFALPAVAHHSTAMFEWGTSTEMKNVTVTRANGTRLSQLPVRE